MVVKGVGTRRGAIGPANLNDIVGLMAGAEDELSLLQSVCDAIAAIEGHELVWVGCADVTSHIRIVAAAGRTEWLKGVSISVGEDAAKRREPAAEAWLSGRPVVSVPGPSRESRVPFAPFAVDPDAMGSIYVPVTRDGQRHALLSVHVRGPEGRVRRCSRRIVRIGAALSRALGATQADQRERALREALLMLERAQAGIALTRNGRLVRLNEACARMLGHERADSLIGSRVLFPPQAVAAQGGTVAQPLSVVVDGPPPGSDGQPIKCEIMGCTSESAESGLAVWTLHDVTEHDAMADCLQGMLEHHPLPVLFIDQRDASIVRANHAAARFYGLGTDELCRMKWSQIVCSGEEGDGDAHALNDPGRRRSLSRHRLANGEVRDVEVYSAPLRADSEGRRLQCSIVLDVSHYTRAEERLEYQALHDALTGLPNRRALELELPRAIARAQRSSREFALGILDLDDFKSANDLFGHECGDQLLRQFAQRLKAELRNVDFLCRFGGDEFVVLLEDMGGLDPQQLVAQVLARVHKAVELPFELESGRRIATEMSMGVALYPQDAEDGETLLRRADAALYEVKAQKPGRAHWWQWVTVRQEHLEKTFDAYGLPAAELLAQCQAALSDVAAEFVAVLHGGAKTGGHDRAEGSGLTKEQLADLKVQELEDARFLLRPALTPAETREHGQASGVNQAFLGVSVAEHALYGTRLLQAVRASLGRFDLSERGQFLLLSVVSKRLQDYMLAVLQAEEATLNTCLDFAAMPLPAAGTSWADVARAEVERLGQLPGIKLAALHVLDAEGCFRIEQSAGPAADALQDALPASLRGSSAIEGQGAVARAWFSRETVHIANCAVNKVHVTCDEAIEALGVQSALVMPILDSRGAPVAVLGLYGAHLRQFESPRMSEFATLLQQRWTALWGLCSTRATPQAAQAAPHTYRRRLFAGGLTMYLQPIISLEGAPPVYFEALARLRLPDGTLVMPDAFLPQLGDVELVRLFRLGLEEVLEDLAAWDRQGYSFSASINLDPSTLRDPNCATWVERTVARHGIDPARVFFELLETHCDDYKSLADALGRLAGTGVRLALDDVGSGYSNLDRLSVLPFHTLKIDRLMLSRIRTAPTETLGALQALMQMARHVNRSVVVEGLEDPGMIEVAAALGAGFGQGFGLAGPMAADEILSWRSRFALPIDLGQVHTFLGALAVHSQLVQRGTGRHGSKAGLLQAFFAERGLSGSDPARWLEELSSRRQGAQAADQRLKQWLAAQVREEVPHGWEPAESTARGSGPRSTP